MLIADGLTQVAAATGYLSPLQCCWPDIIFSTSGFCCSQCRLLKDLELAQNYSVK